MYYIEWVILWNIINLSAIVIYPFRSMIHNYNCAETQVLPALQPSIQSSSSAPAIGGLQFNTRKV